MRVPQTKTQKAKAAIHLVQAILVFVAGCLTLAVMTKSGGFGGQTGFYFALCFFTLPAIIYQVMVPMWSRAWRLNNVYAYASIDILYAILWFAAAIAVAVWNANGIAKGKTETTTDTSTDKQNTRRADNVKKDGTCASFGYGSEIKCSVSKATVGFGIILFLSFALAAYFSIRAVFEFCRTGVLPNANHKNPNHGKEDAPGMEDPGKDVWSTNTDDLNNNHDRLGYGQQRAEDDREELLGRDSDVGSYNQPTDGFAHPGRRPSWHSGQSAPPPPDYDNFAHSALSPTGLPMSPGGNLAMPDGNYNRVPLR